MNKYSSYIFIILILINFVSCSFSKDSAPEEQKGVSLSNRDSNSSKDVGALVWTEIHEKEKQAIQQVLNKNPKNINQSKSEDKIFNEHVNKFDNFTNLILSEKNLEALESFKDISSKDCPDLEISIIYSFMRNDQNRDFSKIESFLKKAHCASQANKTQATAIYHLEVQRQFQKNFKDLSLLRYLIKHPKVHEAERIPLSNSGIFASLRLLHQISVWVDFQIDPITEHWPPVKHSPKPNREGLDYDFPQGLPEAAVDYLYIKDGRAYVGVPRIDCFHGYSISTPCRQIVQYMHGFEDTPEAWQQTIDGLWHMEPDETIE